MRKLSLLIAGAVLCVLSFGYAEVFVSGEGLNASASTQQAGEPSAQEAPFVDVFTVSGKVEVLLSHEVTWREATNDTTLHSGDSIKTGANSYAEISYEGDADKVTRINENTNVAIILGESEKIELLNGEVYSTVKNVTQGKAFEIKTPAGVCGIRGTDWSTTYKDEAMEVEAFDDALYVKNVQKDGSVSQEKTIVSPGYGTRIARFQRPMAPRLNPVQAAQRWSTWKGGLDKRIQQSNLRMRHPMGPQGQGAPQGQSRQQLGQPQGQPQKINVPLRPKPKPAAIKR